MSWTVVLKLWWSVASFQRLSNTHGCQLRILSQKWKLKKKVIILKLSMVSSYSSKSQMKTKKKVKTLKLPQISFSSQPYALNHFESATRHLPGAHQLLLMVSLKNPGQGDSHSLFKISCISYILTQAIIDRPRYLVACTKFCQNLNPRYFGIVR